MITGFQLDVPSDELHTHLANKVLYHQQKAESYQKQLGGIQNLMKDEIEGQTNDPRSGLYASFRSHHAKAQFFKFCADHVVLNEVYRLTQNDLINLEIIERLY